LVEFSIYHIAEHFQTAGPQYEILGAISSIIGELISSTVFAIFLKERKKAIWSSSGSFSAQPRKACSDARQHSDHGSRWLATVQAL